MSDENELLIELKTHRPGATNMYCSELMTVEEAYNFIKRTKDKEDKKNRLKYLKELLSRGDLSPNCQMELSILL